MKRILIKLISSLPESMPEMLLLSPPACSGQDVSRRGHSEPRGNAAHNTLLPPLCSAVFCSSSRTTPRNASNSALSSSLRVIVRLTIPLNFSRSFLFSFSWRAKTSSFSANSFLASSSSLKAPFSAVSYLSITIFVALSP